MKKSEVLIFFAVAMLGAGFEWADGAFSRDFDGYTDEAAHVVSSLLVRDYLTAGFPHNPLTFAREYYAHFPKVAIGHWPPLFHATEAVWTLIFGRTKIAMVIWIAVLAAATTTLIFGWAGRDCGWAAACFGALAFFASPLVHRAISSVMLDMLLALLAMAAAVRFGVYLQSGRKRDGLLFGLLAFAAMATNGRGIAVALLLIPTLAILAPRGEWRWIAGLCGLGIFLTIPARFAHVAPLTIFALGHNVWNFLSRTAMLMSWPVVILAAIGAVAVSRKRRTDVRWAAMLGLVTSVFMFHCFSNWPFEDRYLLVSAPAVAVLAAAGCRACFTSVLPVVLCACVAVAMDASHFSRKPDLGFHVFAATSVAQGHSKSLIAGDPIHEGAYVAEMDLRDRLQSHTILRGSKSLAQSTWAGNDYQMRFASAGEVRTWLNGADITLVIVQTTGRPHVLLLMQAVSGDQAHWRELVKEPLPVDVRIFERVHE